MNYSAKTRLLKLTGFIAILAMLYYVIPVYFERAQNDKINIQEIEKQLEIEKYYSKLLSNETGLPVSQNWKDVSSDGKTMYATINSTHVWTKCSQYVVLKDNNVESYVTQASLWELIVHKGSWHIANVSKSFTDKTHVIEHIQSCMGELDKHYQEKIKLEQKNRKSFDM